MNGKPGVFTAIGLIIGLLAGFLIASSMGNEPAPAPTPAADLHQPADTRNDAAAPLKQETEPAPVRAPGGTSLSDIIATIDPPPVAAGNGVISGRVLTSTGEPLPGVNVTARPRYPDRRYAPDATLEQRVRDNIRYERWREASAHAAITDDSGAYELAGLSEAETYNVWCELDGWRFSARGQTGRVEPGATRDWTATRIFKLAVEVRMPDGSLASEARVTVHDVANDRRQSSEYLGTGAGEIQLEAGEWKIVATGGRQDEYSSDEVVVRTEPGKQLAPLVLTLKGRPGISGTVTLPEALAGTSARVYIVKDPPPEPPVDLQAIRQQRPEQEYVSFYDREEVASTRGEFSRLDIEPGVYRIILDHENEIADWRDITVTNDLVTVDLKVPEPDRSKYFVVRILSPEGDFLADSYANLTIHHGHGWQSGGGQRAAPGRDAIWVKRGEPSSRGNGELPEQWWYTLSATHEEYGTLKRRIERDGPAEQEFRLQAPGTVTLAAIGHNEHELQKSLNWSIVDVGEQGTSLRGFELRERDADANQSPLKFGPMQPGAYDLVLVLGGDFDGSELLRQSVTIAAGENALTASVPALYTLKVRCANESDARRLRLLRDGRRLRRDGEWERTDAAVAEFLNLLAGEYEIEGPTGRMRVTVPVNGTIEFAPRNFDCVVLSSIKEGGLVEGFGLRNGDKLFEVDGETMGDMNQFNARMTLSLAKDSTTWKVLRGGVVTEVTFNGKALMEVMQNKKTNREDLDFDPGFQSD
ncbi:MAG: hypothetical protein K8I27_13140 [Planctomycetes bacterium]|nr:hypothetical protein [Planctomycetota bacterium]